MQTYTNGYKFTWKPFLQHSYIQYFLIRVLQKWPCLTVVMLGFDPGPSQGLHNALNPNYFVCASTWLEYSIHKQSKEGLLSVLNESESAVSLDNIKIKKIREDFNNSRHKFSKSELKEIRKIFMK